VILKGTVYGNIEADSRLEIHANGRLYGNIRTAQLKIAMALSLRGAAR
jgi:cytoskeletal protein CcmA (bactofilin family)